MYMIRVIMLLACGWAVHGKKANGSQLRVISFKDTSTSFENKSTEEKKQALKTTMEEMGIEASDQELMESMKEGWRDRTYEQSVDKLTRMDAEKKVQKQLKEKGFPEYTDPDASAQWKLTQALLKENYSVEKTVANLMASAAEDKPYINVTFLVDGDCASENHPPLRLNLISEQGLSTGKSPRDIENYKCDGTLSMEGMVKSDALKLEKFVLMSVNTKLTVAINLGGRVNIIINNNNFAMLSTMGEETQKESENVLKKMEDMKKNEKTNATITWTINKNMLNENGGELQENIKTLKKELEQSQ